jgi:hypothetical protein
MPKDNVKMIYVNNKTDPTGCTMKYRPKKAYLNKAKQTSYVDLLKTFLCPFK